MASGNSSCSNSNPLKVRIINRNFIKASNLSQEPRILPVSNLDLIPSPDPVAVTYIYPTPRNENFESVISIFNTWLPEFLNYFFPFAGRIGKNLNTGRLEVICNNEGADLVEAQANIPLFDIDFNHTRKSLEVPYFSEAPTLYQLPDLDCLQSLASQGECRATRLEAFSAHVWKILANVVRESDKACQLTWFVDGRPRINQTYASVMENYIGNTCSAVAKEANIKELKAASLSQVATMVANTIESVANEDDFLDLVNWVDGQVKEKYFALHKSTIGLGSPTIAISACHHLPMESDFTFGKAVVGVICLSRREQRLAAGSMVVTSSPSGDGSWIVNVVLWPRVIWALQLDPVCDLKPLIT